MADRVVRRFDSERGSTLLELMVSLIVLSIGVLGVAQLFPTSTRVQVQDRLRTEASQFSREKIEELQTLSINDPSLTQGRHPAGGAVETLGEVGGLQRYYNVDLLAAPLDNLKKVTVCVTWKHAQVCTLQAITYLGR